MKITGHKTGAIYARYAIAPRASISAALRRLSNQSSEGHTLTGVKAKRRANESRVSMSEHRTSILNTNDALRAMPHAKGAIL